MNFQNFSIQNSKKHVNRDFRIASPLISQSSFFEKVRCLIFASSRRKLHRYIEILKFDITIKKIKKFKLVEKLKAATDSYQISYKIQLSITAFIHKF